MRDRLIELLKGFRHPICEGLNAKLPDIEGIADYLLSEGVIVPKVKIGDKLYGLSLKRAKIYEFTITHLKIDKDGIEIWGIEPYGSAPHYIWSEFSLGHNQWVYLAREEAEKVLAERSGE